MKNTTNPFSEEAVRRLLSRVRTVRTEIGTFVGQATSYDHPERIGVGVSNGWLYVLFGETAASDSLTVDQLKLIADRFEKR